MVDTNNNNTKSNRSFILGIFGAAISGIAFIITMGSMVMNRGALDGVTQEKILRLEKRVESIQVDIDKIKTNVTTMTTVINFIREDIKELNKKE